MTVKNFTSVLMVLAAVYASYSLYGELQLIDYFALMVAALLIITSGFARYLEERKNMNDHK